MSVRVVANEPALGAGAVRAPGLRGVVRHVDGLAVASGATGEAAPAHAVRGAQEETVMGETKQVYVRGFMVDDTVMFDEDLSFTIPAEPWVLPLVTLIAEVGVDDLRASIGYGAALIRDAFEIQHRDAVVRPVNRSSEALDHLLRLAAALGVSVSSRTPPSAPEVT